MKVAATFAIVVVGLILLRWVAAVTAAPAGAPPTRSSSAPGDLPSIRSTPEPARDPAEDIDRIAAYEEAMRLADDSVLADELETARDLYFLAAEAVPGDAEASGRVRQVETVLAIDDRTTAWREALDDVEDLLAIAPRSPRIGRAYTEALVGAGQEALIQGNVGRAQRLCGEASQRAPARNDARLCLTRAAGTATATVRGPPAAIPLLPTATLGPPLAPTVRPTPPPVPTPTLTPEPLPTEVATSVPRAEPTGSPGETPGPQSSPTPATAGGS